MPVAEETILLSNERVIKIKPVEIIKKPVFQDGGAADPHILQRDWEEKLKFLEDELEELTAQKERLLQETNEEISEARNNWETEKTTYIEAAQKEGFEAGFAHGREEAMARHAELIDQANAVVSAAQKDYEARLEQSEDTIIELAMAAAGKIMQEKISEDLSRFVPIVSAAIQDIKDQSSVTINVSPLHYEHVQQQKEELQTLLNPDTNLAVYANSKLAENGCIIEHPYGQIDAGVDTQLEQIREILLELALEQRQ